MKLATLAVFASIYGCSVFPATAAKSGEAVKKLRQWSFPEYAQIIKPQLLRLIEQEPEPKVIPAILASWEATDEPE